jgi:hypothetical protein
LKADRDWDLAALSVWRPRAAPLPLAVQAPRPGERLTIAGYGSGWFRTASGECVQYVSPGDRFPAEIIEMATSARNGDSGGPILNDRGEIAGVLFGSASGRTAGSYSGRVRWFLNSAVDDLQRLPNANGQLAGASPPVHAAAAADAVQPSSPNTIQPPGRLVAVPSSLTQSTSPPTPIAVAAQTAPMAASSAMSYNTVESPASIPAIPTNSAPAAVGSAAAAPGWFDQIRNFLSIVGLIALLLFGFRLVGKMTG